MGRDLTRGRTFPDNVARSIKAPLDGWTDEPARRRDGKRMSVIKESRGAAQRKRLRRETISAVMQLDAGCHTATSICTILIDTDAVTFIYRDIKFRGIYCSKRNVNREIIFPRGFNTKGFHSRMFIWTSGNFGTAVPREHKTRAERRHITSLFRRVITPRKHDHRI